MRRAGGGVGLADRGSLKEQSQTKEQSEISNKVLGGGEGWHPQQTASLVERTTETLMGLRASSAIRDSITEGSPASKLGFPERVQYICCELWPYVVPLILV
jgi:hypothetical protein